MGSSSSRDRRMEQLEYENNRLRQENTRVQNQLQQMVHSVHLEDLRNSTRQITGVYFNLRPLNGVQGMIIDHAYIILEIESQYYLKLDMYSSENGIVVNFDENQRNELPTVEEQSEFYFYTQINRMPLGQIFTELMRKWTREIYNVQTNNCYHFCQDALRKLEAGNQYIQIIQNALRRQFRNVGLTAASLTVFFSSITVNLARSTPYLASSLSSSTYILSSLSSYCFYQASQDEILGPRQTLLRLIKVFGLSEDIIRS